MPDASQGAWNDFVVASPEASFLQSWEWGEMQAQLHIPHWRRKITDDHGRVVGQALVIERTLPWGRRWFYIPHGPVLQQGADKGKVWSHVTTQLQALAREQAALFVRIDPTWPESERSALTGAGWKKAEHDVQPRHTLLLDLRQSAEELLAAMHQKTRYNIRVAQKKGVQVRFATDPAAVETFLKLSRDVQARSGFHFHPAQYYHAMHAALAPAGLLEIAIAEVAGEAVAAHILIRFGVTTTYVHGASSSVHRSAMGPHLLQWESITRAKAAGSAWYDFFGVAPADAPADHFWTGITRFKEGFGGERRTYVGAYDYILNPSAYAAFTVARRLRRLWR